MATMNLPSFVKYGTLTGRIIQAILDGVDSDGIPEATDVTNLRILIEPTVTLLQNKEEGVIIYPNREVLFTNDSGVVMNDRSPSDKIQLISTEQGWAPEFRYRIRIERAGAVDLEGFFNLAPGETKNFADLIEWFEPLPESLKAWDAVRAYLEELERKTKASADTVETVLDGVDLSEVAGFAKNAEASAESAKASATNAKTSETNAKNSQSAAASSATAANTSSNAAATSATNAATSAKNAADSATEAKLSETASASSATAAEIAKAAAEKALADANLGAHTHKAADTTSGVFDSARLPRATSSTFGTIRLDNDSLRNFGDVVPTSGALIRELAAIRSEMDEMRTAITTEISDAAKAAAIAGIRKSDAKIVGQAWDGETTLKQQFIHTVVECSGTGNGRGSITFPAFSNGILFANVTLIEGAEFCTVMYSGSASPYQSTLSKLEMLFYRAGGAVAAKNALVRISVHIIGW